MVVCACVCLFDVFVCLFGGVFVCLVCLCVMFVSFVLLFDCCVCVLIC